MNPVSQKINRVGAGTLLLFVDLKDLEVLYSELLLNIYQTDCFSSDEMR